uniref:Putative secreted protein n=1 Tax=Anopheles darlingi TaxID=43151 RepID=A0A2M4D0A3_ANODA
MILTVFLVSLYRFTSRGSPVFSSSWFRNSALDSVSSSISSIGSLSSSSSVQVVMSVRGSWRLVKCDMSVTIS